MNVLVLADSRRPEEQPSAASRERVGEWRQQALERNSWRRDSFQAHEYFDGNQFDAELKQKFADNDLPLLYENCIRRWISTSVGYQAQNLTDGVIKVEDNRYEEFGHAMSARLKEAERMSGTDISCVAAWKSASVGGIGWVEVGDPIDVFQYKHRVEVMSWRELWWDMSDRSPGLQYAEWFRRAKVTKRDDLLAAFPDQRELLASAGMSNDLPWNEQERYERTMFWSRDTGMSSSNYDPNSLLVNEYRYRVWVNGYVMETGMGPQVFDESNPEHMAMFERGEVDPQPARYRRVRRAYWIGPHCLADDWLQLVNNEIGWVPFIYALEDSTGVPYGMARDMIPLQDEVNTRKAKAAVSIDSATIISDDNRMLDANQARKAVNRRKGVILLNSKHPNGKFEIDRHQGITAENMEMYRSARESVGYVHGLDAPYAGTPNSKSQSGVAIQGLVQQSQQAQGLPVSNFADSRKRVLMLLVDRETAEIGNKPTEIRYQRPSDKANKILMLNVPVQMPDGSTEILTPSAIRRVLILDDVPSTATYRQQQFLIIVDTLRSMPPEAQKLMVPALFEMSDLPNREMYADLARKELGIGEPKDEKEAAEQKAQADKQQQIDRLMQMSEEMKIALDQAKAALTAAQAHKVEKETEAIEQDMQAQDMALAAAPVTDIQAVLRW